MHVGASASNSAKEMPSMSKSSTTIGVESRLIAHPGRLLKRELMARGLSANRLALSLGVPSGRVTDILNGRRGITADTAVRLGRFFGNSAQFWLDLQGQYDIAVVERDRGAAIARAVQPADAA
jgi:addiction module HigA family antidote